MPHSPLVGQHTKYFSVSAPPPPPLTFRVLLTASLVVDIVNILLESACEQSLEVIIYVASTLCTS